MLSHSLHVLSFVIFLQHAVDTKPVKERLLSESYEEFKSNQSSCSLNDKNTEQHFKELCADKRSPDSSKIEEEAFTFDFIPYLCYTVLHNLKTACSHTDKDFPSFQSSDDPGKFCSNMSPIEIPENCSHWLADQDRAEADCKLVRKVVGVILNNKTCHENCIKNDKIDPLCQDLVRSSLILADLASKSTSQSTPPGLSKPKQPDQSKNQTKEPNEESKSAEVVTKTSSIASSTMASTMITTLSSSVSSTVGSVQAKDTNKVEAPSEEKDTNNDEEKPVNNENLEEKEEAENDSENEEDTLSDDTDAAHDPEVDSPNDTETDAESETSYSGRISSGPSAEAQSNFFSYFILLSIVAILAYLVFHNKQKVSES